jgi:hypothetical protein
MRLRKPAVVHQCAFIDPVAFQSVWIGPSKKALARFCHAIAL